VMFFAFALAGLASFSWEQGWFGWLILGESIIAVGVCFALRLALARAHWKSIDA